MSANYPNGVLHPACGKRFRDNNTTGHCSGCCETFCGIAAFDAHRRRGVCIPPDPARPWRLDHRGEWHWRDPAAFILAVTGSKAGPESALSGPGSGPE